MWNPTHVDQDRLISVAAVCLCLGTVAVAATALESSLSTTVTPAPPDDSSTGGPSLLALFYALLDSILSLFGLDPGPMGYGRSGPSVVQAVTAVLRSLYRHRLPLLAGLVLLTALGLGARRRNWSGSPSGRPSSGDSIARSGESTPEAWPPGTPSNDVARTWVEMSAAVDASEPHARTPAEWRAAAIADGLDPDAVGTITGTFREVTYGDEPVTESRREGVRRALSALSDERSESPE